MTSVERPGQPESRDSDLLWVEASPLIAGVDATNPALGVDAEAAVEMWTEREVKRYGSGEDRANTGGARPTVAGDGPASVEPKIESASALPKRFGRNVFMNYVAQAATAIAAL